MDLRATKASLVPDELLFYVAACCLRRSLRADSAILVSIYSAIAE